MQVHAQKKLCCGLSVPRLVLMSLVGISLVFWCLFSGLVILWFGAGSLGVGDFARIGVPFLYLALSLIVNLQRSAWFRFLSYVNLLIPMLWFMFEMTRDGGSALIPIWMASLIVFQFALTAYELMDPRKRT